MVLVQKWPFFELFFSGNIGKENILNDILERKSVFLGYKNKKFKKSKNWHFSKGVNPWFRSKNGYFSNFSFLVNIVQENVLYDILEQKNAFLAYQNKKIKKSKFDIFKKGLTHGFGPKMAIFERSLLRQYRQGKCLLRYSSTKKGISML